MKIWKKGLAVLLVLALAVSLCACGEKEEDKLVGTWKCEYDMTDYMAKTIEASLGEELEVNAKLTFPMTLTLNKDRSCTLEIDGEAYIASIQTYMDSLVDSLVAYLCQSMGMSQEELDAVMQEQSGVDTAEYCREIFGGVMDEDQMLEEVEKATSSGTYSVKDGKIVIVDEDGTTEEPAYTLDGDTLTLDFNDLEIAEGFTLGTLIFKKA